MTAKETFIEDVNAKIAEIIKNTGDTEYKYYAIPVRWNSRIKEHISQITGLESFEITKEEWLKNKDESKRISYQAFIGKYKMSYTDYDRKIVKDGWREVLIKWLKDDGNFSG